MNEFRKISFEEAWDTSTIFFVDDELEDEIDARVHGLLEIANDHRVSEISEIEVDNVTEFLRQNPQGINVILKDIELSEEKFKRIISLLRKIGRVGGGFQTEWSISRIKSEFERNSDFAEILVSLLVDGKRDAQLANLIPRYYLDKLNYREIGGSSSAARRIRYKSSLIGTYGGRKGYYVEDRIEQKLREINQSHGLEYGKGRSRMIDTDIDFAIPNVRDPWVIIMSSFQETTSSGQTTKAAAMLDAFERIQRSNNRHGENRAFVNFVDGGGWLARKRDMERLVDNCHYFVNLNTLDMLEAIVLGHVPEEFFGN